MLLLRNRQPRNDVSVGAILSSDAMQFPLQHDCPPQHDCALALPPLAQYHICFAFRPAAAGTINARFRVMDSVGTLLRSRTRARQGGEQAPSQLAWREPPALAFGNVALGVSSERTAQLVNASAAPVQLQRLRLTGPNASRFTLDTDCAAPARLLANGTCELRVRFAPSTAGLAEAWVESESDVSNAPLARMSASGVTALDGPTVPPAPPPPPPEGYGGGTTSLAWLALLGPAVSALAQPFRCRSARRRSL